MDEDTSIREETLKFPFAGNLELTFYTSGGPFRDRKRHRNDPDRIYRNFSVLLGSVSIATAKAYNDGEWSFWTTNHYGSPPVFTTRGAPSEFVSFLENAGRIKTKKAKPAKKS